MTKRIKFLFVTLVLSLGFLFCFRFTSLSVNADEGVEDTTPQTEQVETQEQEEQTPEEAIADSFLAHLKDFKWDEAEAVIGWIIAYLVANFGVIAGLAITLILKKTSQVKDSKAFKDALAKMTLENQEETQKLIKEFEDKLNKVYDENQMLILEQQEKLEKLTNDQTKQIASELTKVTNFLNE